MAQESEQKIKISAGLSPRVVTLIQKEANRVGISFADVLRRITDNWADSYLAGRPPGFAAVAYNQTSGERAQGPR